ncbi:MAG TPA: (Fe-S)-binding protein [Symbiobacteriaceae bacterium]|jgi:L-lactate dehydrogenase complex protein LldE
MKVSLFVTCLADHFFPEVGEAVVHLLRRHGVSVDFPAGQTCCGQPAWNTGEQETARAMAAHYIRTFENSEYVVMPSGSCGGHIRYYYPQMFKDDKAMFAKAVAVSEKSYEFTEFMVKVLGVTDVGARFKAKATYHSSCHMTRELGVRDEPLAMLRAVRDLELVDMPRADLCCGFGGAFSVKMPEISTAMADEKLGHVASTKADVLVGADGACLMHMAGRAERIGMNVRTMHIAQLLWEGVQKA